MPNTYKAISIEIEGEVLPMTPKNQDYLAIMKVQELLDKGHDAKEIALIWNSSLGGSEKPLVKKGRNKLGVAYDTLAYASKVLVAYAQE